MDTTDNYELLIDKINVFIRRYYFNNFLRGLIFLGAGLFSAYVVITLSEYFGNFNILFRTLLFYLFIALNLGLVVWLILPPLLAWMKLGKSLTHDEAAEIIGRHFNDVHDKLLNTLQLKKQAGSDARNRALIEASINQKIESLKPVSFPSAVNIRENRRYLKWLLLPAAVICIIAFAAPTILTESTKRLIRHDEYFAPVAPFTFNVQNKSLAVVQGDDLKLDLKMEGDKLPADVYVETANNTFKLDKENISRFHYLFTNVQQNTTFRLTANGFSSASYEIKVSLRPVLLHFDVMLNYPAYLHKKNETVKNAGDLTIPAGTVVTWQFHTRNTSSLLFSMNDAEGNVSGDGEGVFEHKERILKNSAYKITPVNNTVNHTDPAAYRINVIQDEMPSISVEEKQDSVSIKALYFNGLIQDDHGFSSLNFHYAVGDPADKANLKNYSRPVKADLSQSQANFFYYWNLKDLGIKPGDRVTYYFEVADNDGVNGPKKVRSPERTINIPDAKELNDQLDAGTQAVKQKMESAIKLAAQIERDEQKLNQLLLNKNTLSFDEKKQIEDLLQKRKDLEDLVKEVQADNKKNLYNRQENQQQSEELAQKQQQMDKLLNQLLDPKTQDMLQRLQQLLEQEQKEGTRNELQRMQGDNKSLKKELDRMLELYKQLEFEQKLNQNAAQLDKLAEQQQKLADETKKNETPQQDLQNRQQQLNKDFQDVKKALDELKKSNEEAEHPQKFDDPKQDEQNIEQQMENSSDALQKKDNKKAASAQKQAAGQMKKLAEKMKRNEAEGQESEAQVDAQQLRELLKNLVNSSFAQEKNMQAVRTTNSTDPNYIKLAQDQKDIQDNLKTAEDSLYALSRRVPQIQTTVNTEIASINDHIKNALDNLGDRRTAEATRHQQYAMTSMNNLALMLSEALEQLQNMQKNGRAGKGKSNQPSLSQLAKMQRQLNQNMQKAREQLQRMGPEGNKGKNQSGNNENISEQLAKLARQQQEIREALQRINQEENKDGKSGLGDLDKISKEMEQTERDLVNRRITEEAVKRQQQIHTRLLEAEKAEQEREQDNKRESRAGKDVPPGYIKALQDYEQARQKQTEQVRTVPPALNFYYKTKIKSYFDLLNVK
ncbi:MAG TPA: DUF4175 family protein [Mucilaginibacter sp.]|nr:DUF4175 family protein [Mucilaginibacter sp.]